MKLGRVIWLTGLPRSGKSTLARALVAALLERDVPTLWLDSDDLRAVMTPEATYSDRERDIFYATLAHLAALAVDGGVTAVVSATANKRTYRDAARAKVTDFYEVYVHCADATRAARDHAGLYSRAKSGQIANLPGAGAAYEEPLKAELDFETDRIDNDAMVRAVLASIGV